MYHLAQNQSNYACSPEKYFPPTHNAPYYDSYKIPTKSPAPIGSLDVPPEDWSQIQEISQNLTSKISVLNQKLDSRLAKSYLIANRRQNTPPRQMNEGFYPRENVFRVANDTKTIKKQQVVSTCRSCSPYKETIITLPKEMNPRIKNQIIEREKEIFIRNNPSPEFWSSNPIPNSRIQGMPNKQEPNFNNYRSFNSNFDHHSNGQNHSLRGQEQFFQNPRNNERSMKDSFPEKTRDSADDQSEVKEAQEKKIEAERFAENNQLKIEIPQKKEPQNVDLMRKIRAIKETLDVDILETIEKFFELTKQIDIERSQTAEKQKKNGHSGKTYRKEPIISDDKSPQINVFQVPTIPIEEFMDETEIAIKQIKQNVSEELQELYMRVVKKVKH